MTTEIVDDYERGYATGQRDAQEVVEEMRAQLPAVRSTEIALTSELGVDEILRQQEMIEDLMRRGMKENVHYGTIPGTDKPSLWKPGAEKLGRMFKLAPSYTIERDRDEGHYDVFVTCQLTHITSGLVCGEGIGFCSTRESRYAYRNAKRTCPACGAEAIIKGKEEYGGGWLCWKKSEPVAGCGAKYHDGDPVIEGQNVGKTDNENLPDLWNTVVKMAKKRALVDATLTVTAASDIFTQDMAEETPDSRKPSQAPRSPQDAEEILTVTQEQADLLRECLLVAHELHEGWSEEAVMKTASQTAGRTFTKLEQLAPAEGKALQDSLTTWLAENGPPIQTDENIPGIDIDPADADEIPF